jgi:hypothetical protein
LSFGLRERSVASVSAVARTDSGRYTPKPAIRVEAASTQRA